MKKIIFLVVFSFIILPVSTRAAFQFQNRLMLGVVSSEVKVLQQTLNSDPNTAVATFGVGSKGFETERFGFLTQSAVMKFQAKNGLVADGIVGTKTRAKLNEKLAANLILTNPSNITYPAGQNPNLIYPHPVTTNTASSSTATSSGTSSVLAIRSISPENVTPGESFDVYGTGFTKTSKVYLGLNQQVSFDFIDSGHIKVKTPSGSSILGVQLLYITNSFSDTKWTNPAFSMVTSNKLSGQGGDLNRILGVVKTQNQKNLSSVSTEEKGNKEIFKTFKTVLAWFFGETPKALAQSLNIVGGQITYSIVCTCVENYGIILHIQDKTAGGANPEAITVYKPPISRLDSNFNAFFPPDLQVLAGTMEASFQCEEQVGYYCIPTGDSANSLIDTIRGVGTSI